MNQLHITLHSGDEQFFKLREQWAELWEHVEGANLFQSYEWLSNWWAAYREDRELILLSATAPDGKLVGMLPLTSRRAKRYRLPCRELSLLGDGSFETEHVVFLARSYDSPDSTRLTADEVTLALLDYAYQKVSWDVFVLSQLLGNSPGAALLKQWCSSRGLTVLTMPAPCLVQNFPSTYEDFLKSLKPRLRTHLRSVRRKLEDAHLVHLTEVLDESELEPALEALFSNHQSRWHSIGEPGAFAWPQRRAFYRRLAPDLLRRGWLRFFALEVDGAIVAQQFCLYFNHSVFLLQEGFRAEFKDQSVGNVLRSLIFERLIGEGVRTYDFLSGNEPHKHAWSNGVVLDATLEVFRDNHRGRFFRLLPRVIQLIKHVFKTVLPESLFRKLQRWKTHWFPETDTELSRPPQDERTAD